MKNIFLILSVFLFFIVSCGNKPDEAKVNSMLDSLKEIPATAPSDSDQFGYKTGVIVYTSSTMGINQEITMWFDDFGRVTLSEIKSSMLGQQIHQLNIVKDSMVYNIDMISKSGTWMALSDDSASASYNYRTLTNDDLKMYNIVFEGNEDFLGKECKIYSQKEMVNDQEIDMKVWIWEGLPLKSISTVSGIKVSMEALNLKVNIDIPAGKFDVPAGVTIKEVSESEKYPS
ncbi:MAG: hypothetical protein A2W93_02565 [Bacteroidetes bacterium GWF2_43_63]|nr:MAG: hypothetical protein A2W94_08575 [Bacteroidetes bacterium GWE2_42_42]OFY53552.1 MAG: hypothetical protein A2W93_02565 [Bacteroidetes bacterium GWF2_43_63]HBG71117.1 hypothetical protein [Bacteroidales bacterium]HCB63694.1 hypothetical protein [Bacteroidales bacterium]HCY24443.1 hypothetical protein [Bacteroidales bacterium]